MNRLETLQQELTLYKKKKISTAKAMRYSRDHAAPALFGIAGLEAVEAATLGLGIVGVLSPVFTKSGNLSIRSDKAERLLTSQARMKLNRRPKKIYTYNLLWIAMSKPLVDAAETMLEVTWEGNDYGEIGGAYIRRKLKETSAFTKSSLDVSFTKLDTIPPDTMKDPREWPIVFAYDGTYDPYGNGQFEFQGEFEINAFGGLRFRRHEVKSVSLMDWTISGSDYNKVKKQSDHSYTVPALPQEQKEFLLEQLKNP